VMHPRAGGDSPELGLGVTSSGASGRIYRHGRGNGSLGTSRWGRPDQGAKPGRSCNTLIFELET
jgi:hypothetical protein